MERTQLNAGKVLLTDAAAKSTLAAVRALARRGLEVHVAADTRLALAKWSRLAKRRHWVPNPQSQPRQFAASLAELQRRENFDAVIPVSDYDIAALLAHQDAWRDAGMKMALPRGPSTRLGTRVA